MALPDANLGYNYDTLPGPQSIRLLTIHPAENITDSIKCSIETVDLVSEKDKYDAISYSWGMDDGSGDAFLLTLDDKPFYITQNLWDGLRRIRRCKEPVRIWIDAVCINQNDDAEKSVQVLMMADIYAGAENVHVWLGEGEDASEDKLFLKVLKLMEERAVTFRPWKDLKGRHYHCFVLPLLGKGASRCSGCVTAHDDNTLCEVHVDWLTNKDAHVDWMSKWFVSDPAEGHNATKMTNLGIKFFSRRYWKRRWILQELAFAKKQLLYWGGCVMDVSNLPEYWLGCLIAAVEAIVLGLRSANFHTLGSDYTAFDVYSLEHNDPILSRLPGLSEFCTPQTDWKRQTLTWRSCLRAFHSSECSDPRDMYYALASMIEPRIRVDYTLTQAEVFVNFAKMMLGLGEWVWVFYCAAHRARAINADQGRNTNTLPSWVPDPRLVDIQDGGGHRPTCIQILEGNALLCDVRCIGVVHKSKRRRTELRWNRLFWQICSSHRALATHQSVEDFLKRPKQLAPLQLYGVYESELRSGDIVCSCQEEFSEDDVWLILRLSQFASQTYTLVGAAETWVALDKFTLTKVQAFSTCPKIKVRII
jgi:hypothetical protein